MRQYSLMVEIVLKSAGKTKGAFMKTLQERAERREHLIKSAQDSIVERASKIFISQYRVDLEHLQRGEQVESHIPVGKDKFVEWTKNLFMNDQSFASVSGTIENETLLKQYAVQIADYIAKSNTDLVNPMKDYKPKKEKVYERAASNKAPVKKADVFVPSGSIKTPNLHTAPVEHSRYCPEHPGAMMRRVKDNLYQCPINGDLNTVEPWKEKYDYRGGHEVGFQTGVQNQTSEGRDSLHPLLPFLHPEANYDGTLQSKGKPYDFEKLYGVSAESPERQSTKLAEELLGKITRFAEKSCSKCEDKNCDCGCFDDPSECSCSAKKEASTKTAGDARMSKSFVKNILEMASNLDRIINPDMDLDDWVDAKITKANEALTDVENFLKNYPEEPTLTFVASSKISKTAQQLFGPTTLMTRQCPDHPGQQLSRIADNARQCPLDHKIYDFVAGFTTADGKKHNGGSVQAQQAIPPGSILVKAARRDVVADTPMTHEFLYKILQHLPASAERERKILNYKFEKSVPLEQAINAIKQAEELGAQPQQTTPPTQVAASSKVAMNTDEETIVAGLMSFAKTTRDKGV